MTLEVYAAYERHMQERDALISDRIGCSAAYWAGMRETNLLWWEMMEQKAMMTPPRLRPGKAFQQRRAEDARFEAGEYLRWSQSRPAPAGSQWDWLGWGIVAAAVFIFFVQRIPVVHTLFARLVGM